MYIVTYWSCLSDDDTTTNDDAVDTDDNGTHTSAADPPIDSNSEPSSNVLYYIKE